MDKQLSPFERGDKLPEVFSVHFDGDTYLSMLVPDNSPLKVPIGNVTFAPGSKNHWHIHPGGQILLATAGCGWYQAEGESPRRLKPGDVVEILPGVKHWHGAAQNSWFSHLAIETGASAGPAQWLEPVPDEVYQALEGQR
ncbi:MAG TPA: cupin domain-containing protein [Candidatus Limiplasma sp.]|nr:cupin domain-containing protein [Candidatus Limiplasma sp.]